jgi:hypothetical protein
VADQLGAVGIDAGGQGFRAACAGPEAVDGVGQLPAVLFQFWQPRLDLLPRAVVALGNCGDGLQQGRGILQHLGQAKQ